MIKLVFLGVSDHDILILFDDVTYSFSRESLKHYTIDAFGDSYFLY